MDSIDVAQNNEEVIQQAAIKKALQSSKNKQIQPTGFCRYCEEPIDKGLFCDIDCSNDYEWVNKCKSERG